MVTEKPHLWHCNSKIGQKQGTGGIFGAPILTKRGRFRKPDPTKLEKNGDILSFPPMFML